MAWIESHQTIVYHPKTFKLMEDMGWNLNETIGILHRFWYWCVDYAEDGNLKKYNDSQLAKAVGLTASDGKRFVEAMINCGGEIGSGFIDRNPYFRVHDWWDYIGLYLQRKYASRPEKWQKVRQCYETDTLVYSPNQPNQPNQPDQPNQPNQPDQPNQLKKKEYSKQGFELALLLKNLILKDDSKHKITNNQLRNWAMEADKMVRLDKRSYEEIRIRIQYARKNEFWKGNFFSIGKLRQRPRGDKNGAMLYDRLTEQMRKEGYRSPEEREEEMRKYNERMKKEDEEIQKARDSWRETK